MHKTRSRVARLRAGVIGLAVVVALSLLGQLPASAAPAAPSGLTPTGTSESATPVLQWDRVPGATSYRIEVSASSTFSPLLWNTTTVNRRAVPARNLPVGEVHWRVQAVDGTGSSPWSSASFNRNGVAGPTQVAPADGAQLPQPAQAALLSWTPVAGAESYTIEIDDAADFIGATPYTTKTSSYVVPNPQIKTTYYWRVRATLQNGILTEWSGSRTYAILGLSKPVLVGPSPSGATTQVEDVVLEWEPVDGARAYQLQVSTDENFLTFDGGIQESNVKSTRYSPAITLNNDQFYWRVRPIDAQGNMPDWTQMDTWLFQRHWPDQPDLEYPVDNQVVGDPFYYQWHGVEHASHYTLEISQSPTFGPSPHSDLCTTRHTTFVPQKKDDCWPQASGTYYWRVTGYDAPQTNPNPVRTDTILAEVGQFTYEPGQVQQVAPLNGATVEIPTLSWEPVAGASRYKVTVTAVDGGGGGGAWTTAALSYTPRGKLTVGKTYRWQVQTVSESGREGPLMFEGDQPTFTVAAMTTPTTATPEPVSPAEGATSTRFPMLTWSPVAGATSYRVYIRRGTTGLFYELAGGSFGYPAGVDDTDDWLAPDLYQWRVDAYGSSGLISSMSSPASFRIGALDTVTGHRAAITGVASGSPSTSCAAVLPAQCIDMRQTPVLRWDPNPDTGYYMLYISRDKEMTNPVSGYFGLKVESSMWTPPDTLKDSQAGSAYYWLVQPCQYGAACPPLAHADHAFAKLTNPVEPLSPAEGAVVKDAVTFTWRDYLATNLDAAGTDATGVNPRLEARQYRIQVASDPNFQVLVDDATVDQTTYTAYAKTYPEGPLYWRVQAIDGTTNPMAWSRLRVENGADVPFSITKSSPGPSLLTPLHGNTVGATEPFRWQPLDFAASYDVEVYKDADVTANASNLVLSGNSKQVAFTATTPLPASTNPYLWRVRRVDADGRKGQWSPLAPADASDNPAFKIVGTKPVPLTPGSGAVVAADDSFFAWQAVDNAVSYRFERRIAGSTSTAETVNTPSLAWAPTSKLTSGTWEWRVSSVDTGGKIIASSDWTSFTVPATTPTTTTPPPSTTTPPPTTTTPPSTTADTVRPTVSKVSPTGKVKRDVNFKAVFSERVKNVTTKTMKLKQKGKRGSLEAKVTLSSDGRTAKLNPKRNLKPGKVYIVKLTSGVKDPSGNQLVAKSWRVTAK